MAYILALDQGTTGTRAYIFDRRMRPVASAYQEFRQYYPRPGWVEHDAEEIWKSSLSVIGRALSRAHVRAGRIAAIGITNQRETTVLWDRRTSRPVARAIVWQCRRTSETCAQLKRRGFSPVFQKKTGLVIDPYFSGTKISWMLDRSASLRQRAVQGKIAFGTIDSWLIWKLTSGASHVTDFTNASRTLCFDIRKRMWSPELLKILRIPNTILPQVTASVSSFGLTRGLGILPDGIPITGVAGDQQAALFGQGCVHPGSMKNTYGTGCFLVVNTGSRFVRSKSGFLTTIACGPAGKPVFALEGAVFIAGAAVQWLRDELGLIRNAGETERIAKSVSDTGGVYMVPAFVGLGAPHWNANARGLVTGITRGTNRAVLVRATLESLAYQTKDIVDAMKSEFGRKLAMLRVDGGAAANNFLMQFQADILGLPLTRPKMLETTARGAALLAGIAVGLYSEKNLMPAAERIFRPCMKKKTREQLFAGWKHAVRQTLFTYQTTWRRSLP